MIQSLNVEATLLSTAHPHISKHTSIRSLLVSTVIGLTGISSILVSVSTNELSTTMNMVFLTLGTILILVSLYRFFWKSNEVVYLPTGSVVSEGTRYIDSCDLDTMARLIEDKDFNLSERLSFKHSGNGRVDYLVSKDRQFAAVQLFRFVPYMYEPATQVYYYTGDDAAAFARYLCTKSN